jgi:hypothetical protein
MARDWKARPTPAKTSLTEIARRYHAAAVALAQTLGLSVPEVLMQHRESVTAIFIEASRAELRLPASVQLSPLVVPPQAEAPAEAAPTVAHGETVPPTMIPPDAGLPCGGQGNATLKPAQLAMLLGKVTRLAEAKGGPWEVLRQALQAERADRITRGQRRSGPKLVPEGEAHEA